MITFLMVITFISMIFYVLGEILLVKHNIFTFYMFIISNLLVILQLLLNKTFFENINVVFINLFSLVMGIIGIYNWKKLKNKNKL
jgi:hypothetical protein